LQEKILMFIWNLKVMQIRILKMMKYLAPPRSTIWTISSTETWTLLRIRKEATSQELALILLIDWGTWARNLVWTIKLELLILSHRANQKIKWFSKI
jgi:hypothetical protein